MNNSEEENLRVRIESVRSKAEKARAHIGNQPPRVNLQSSAAAIIVI